MARKKYKLPWQADKKRYRKQYKGQWFYFPCASKSDRECRKEAQAAFERFRADIDQKSDSEKPHFADYERARRWRTDIIDACQHEIDLIDSHAPGAHSTADEMVVTRADEQLRNGRPLDELSALSQPSSLSDAARKREVQRVLNQQQAMLEDVLPQLGVTLDEYDAYVMGRVSVKDRERMEKRLKGLSELYGEWMRNSDRKRYCNMQHRMRKELNQLDRWFKQVKPRPLDQPNSLPVDPLAMETEEAIVDWIQRLDFHSKYKRLSGDVGIEGERVTDHIDRYLEGREPEVKAGSYKASSYRREQQRLEKLRNHMGTKRSATISAVDLSGYRSRLLDEAAASTICLTEAKNALAAAKRFVYWLSDHEILETLPRNFRKWRIKAAVPKPEVFSQEEFNVLIRAASERTRLFLLLMLNCGQYAADIAQIRHGDVDWPTGRLTYKRAKESDESNVPEVCYPLWDETFRLLQQHRNEQSELVLTNQNGSPLHQVELVNGKVKVNDNIRTAIGRTYRRKDVKGKVQRTPSDLRNTGASKLFNDERHAKWRQLYLGHSPQGIEAIHYRSADQPAFEEAIVWLGKQFGFETDISRLGIT